MRHDDDGAGRVIGSNNRVGTPARVTDNQVGLAREDPISHHVQPVPAFVCVVIVYSPDDLQACSLGSPQVFPRIPDTLDAAQISPEVSAPERVWPVKVEDVGLFGREPADFVSHRRHRDDTVRLKSPVELWKIRRRCLVGPVRPAGNRIVQCQMTR